MASSSFSILATLIPLVFMLLVACVYVYIISLVIKLLKRTIALVEKKLRE